MTEDSRIDTGFSDALERARSIALLFDLPGPVEAFDFTLKGNINQHTYLIKAGPPEARAEYLLQLLNPRIFKQPRAVMQAMVACIQAQQEAISEGSLRSDEEWETIRLVPTRDGMAYLEIGNEEGLHCWRMMERIRHAYTYRSLSDVPDAAARLRVAEEAGRGLALFGILTAGMNPSEIHSSLPGYRDTSLYYDQLISLLAGNRTLREAVTHLPANPIVRQCTEQQYLVQIEKEEYRRRLEDRQLGPFIALALEQKPFALLLGRGLMAGDLKKVVIHGDTKLDNFLFSASTGKVKALVDLDTIMPHTWLADWGDMIRSLVNVAGERETDPERIDVDLEVFKAVARGFLGSSPHVALQEIKLMVDAAQIMALELGVRFLADYLRGDSYFKLSRGDPGDLNKTRALVQFCVFKKLRKNEQALKRCIEELRSRGSRVGPTDHI
jgi:hypothetical protein